MLLFRKERKPIRFLMYGYDFRIFINVFILGLMAGEKMPIYVDMKKVFHTDKI